MLDEVLRWRDVQVEERGGAVHDEGNNNEDNGNDDDAGQVNEDDQ